MRWIYAKATSRRQDASQAEIKRGFYCNLMDGITLLERTLPKKQELTMETNKIRVTRQ